MAAHPESSVRIPCASSRGDIVAYVQISLFDRTDRPETLGARHPLLLLDNDTAAARGESPVQLRERARYEYVVEEVTKSSEPLILLPGRSIQPSLIDSTRGIIEPGDFCGSLPLTLIREGDQEERPAAKGIVEVRSIKVDYGTHYRGMLRFIGEKSAGLLLDARASTKLSLSSLWNRSSNIVEQQLEFLRSLLEAEDFGNAIEQILRHPHQRLEEEFAGRSITRACKPDRGLMRQITSARIRRALPESHCLSSRFASVPRTVFAKRRVDDYDTPENRFIVMALRSFRDFLERVETFVKNGRQAVSTDAEILVRDSKRLRRFLEQQLSRSFLPDISLSNFIPIASPVLQRRAGYREILRFWLQFHAAAQVVWEGGFEVFSAGSRDVATLYEYWLFFQLEELLRRKFAFVESLHSIVIDRTNGLPRLKLRRNEEVAIGRGFIQPSHGNRKLLAEFHYNRRFAYSKDHTHPGSWTRAVRPDYTLTIWPDGLGREEAEAQELLVHIHFDAKYRIDFAQEIFGPEVETEKSSAQSTPGQSSVTSAKYEDLLKMHAYRDSVRRTVGAYILYPGEPGSDRTFCGYYHEILPGLGAFAVRPDKDGHAHGLSSVEAFIDDVVEHLASRLTARERVTFHVSEAYSSSPGYSRERGSIALPETDHFSPAARAVPLAEHQVLVAWYDSFEQLEWTRQAGKAIIRLGNRPGAWRIPPFIAEVQHILLHTHQRYVAPGLWQLNRPGLEVYTGEELKTKFKYPLQTGSQIYAVFEVSPDPFWSDATWDPDILLHELQNSRSSRRQVPLRRLGRLSPYPEVLSLANLMRALRRN